MLAFAPTASADNDYNDHWRGDYHHHGHGYHGRYCDDDDYYYRYRGHYRPRYRYHYDDDYRYRRGYRGGYYRGRDPVSETGRFVGAVIGEIGHAFFRADHHFYYHGHWH